MKMPYTEALMESIPKLDQPSHTRLRTIPGRPPDLVDPPAGLPVRAPLHLRPRPLPGGAAELVDAEPPGHRVRVLVSSGLARVPRDQTNDIEAAIAAGSASLMAGTGTAHLRDARTRCCASRTSSSSSRWATPA